MKRRLFLSAGSAAAFVAMGWEAAFDASADSGIAPEPVWTEPSVTVEEAVNTSWQDAAPLAPQSAPVTGYAFGARLDKYVGGILPNVSHASMDALLTQHYDAWKATRIVPMDNVVPGGLAVKFSDESFSTVPEGMGYGMLLAVLFEGHDPHARQLFDGLLATVRARPSYGIMQSNPVGKFLMDWRLYPDGQSAGEGWNAVDGDLDIAMALLMAHRQWGSDGAWNYLEEGRNTINAIKEWNMAPDGTTKGLRLAHVSRTSDYMIGHFRAFERATQDAFWGKAIQRAHQLIAMCQTRYSPVGLMPDFLMNTDSDPTPSTGYVGDGNDMEGFFWWNACRNPMRFAADYVLSGDAESLRATSALVDFFQNASGGNPMNIGMGYALDGTRLDWGGQSAAFSGPICAGACVDSRFQQFADAMWDWNKQNLTTGYYDSELQLLSMVVASGNWWSTARG